MKSVTDTIRAFVNKEACRGANNTSSTGKMLCLYDIVIAEWREDGLIWITPAGYVTITTFDRLRILAAMVMPKATLSWYHRGTWQLKIGSRAMTPELAPKSWLRLAFPLSSNIDTETGSKCWT